ncbi:hypothetical protein D9758_017966 [Tetrapyrgos nigripes]|uniref:Uncharacterized protein n=1 Tax=Tetrapyrgos nigripes TaxID=182062 RepID=A0A8H5FGD6_9AGAR|nr:hypothetical protein D9758_017966 [Tetrapyrgos nigripes]
MQREKEHAGWMREQTERSMATRSGRSNGDISSQVDPTLAPVFAPVEWQSGQTATITFPSLLKITANHFTIPLPFFTTKNLTTLTEMGSGLPMKQWRNPTSGAKEIVVDLDALAKTLKLAPADDPTEGLQHHEAVQALDNFYNFNVQRDPHGVEGLLYSDFWQKHCNFFISQPDSYDNYKHWKPVEKQLRLWRLIHNTAFSQTDYAQRYREAQMAKEMERKTELLIASAISGSRPPASGPSRSVPLTQLPRHQPFPTSGKDKKGSSCCLGCGALGHMVAQHPAGQPLRWARLDARSLFTPNTNRQICLGFNIYGTKKGQDRCKNCNHEHICSFCGSSTHYAFAWHRECTVVDPRPKSA